MTPHKKAEMLNALGNELQEGGRLAEAFESYRQAAAIDPSWATPLYNLGLVCKKQRRWAESLEYNRRSAALDPGHQPAWWNLGIAATALGRWDVARAAWRGFGVKVPDGDGPLDLPCGFGPIRLNPTGEGEVVWANRLDPARAELASIPFPESGYRWRDVVLNDGEPVGSRRSQGQDFPVLNAIMLLQRSPFATHIARVRLPNRPDYLVKLADTAAKLEGSAEDWSTSVRIICQACSEGRVHQEHDTAAAPPPGAHLIGIAARDRDHATDILNSWEADLADVEVESLSDPIAAEPVGGNGDGTTEG